MTWQCLGEVSGYDVEVLLSGQLHSWKDALYEMQLKLIILYNIHTVALCDASEMPDYLSKGPTRTLVRSCNSLNSFAASSSRWIRRFFISIF